MDKLNWDNILLTAIVSGYFAAFTDATMKQAGLFFIGFCIGEVLVAMLRSKP